MVRIERAYDAGLTPEKIAAHRKVVEAREAAARGPEPPAAPSLLKSLRAIEARKPGGCDLSTYLVDNGMQAAALEKLAGSPAVLESELRRRFFRFDDGTGTIAKSDFGRLLATLGDTSTDFTCPPEPITYPNFIDWWVQKA